MTGRTVRSVPHAFAELEQSGTRCPVQSNRCERRSVAKARGTAQRGKQSPLEPDREDALLASLAARNPEDAVGSRPGSEGCAWREPLLVTLCHLCFGHCRSIGESSACLAADVPAEAEGVRAAGGPLDEQAVASFPPGERTTALSRAASPALPDGRLRSQLCAHAQSARFPCPYAGVLVRVLACCGGSGMVP
jgi:hypothetical protein